MKSCMGVISAPISISFLVTLALCLQLVLAFQSFPPKTQSGHVPPRPRLVTSGARFAHNKGANHVPTTTTNTRTSTDQTRLEFQLPMRQQILKIESRLQEMKERSSRGERFTQEYCDSILGLCVAADEWETVLDVLDIMKSQGLSQERSSYRSCLQACFEMGNGASAEETLQGMEQAGVEALPSDIGLVAAAMCRNNKQENGWWRKAQELLLSRPSPDVPIDAFDAVFACLCDENNWKASLQLLKELEGVSGESRKNKIYPSPTLDIYRYVIECCVASDQTEQAMRIVISMTEKQLKPTIYTFEIVISALAKRLQWRRALQLLDLMEQCERPRTVLVYNTIIMACCKAKEVGMAKNLLSRMRKENLQPTIMVYNNLMSACANTNRWKDAMAVLDQCNRDPHCSPDIYTYTNAIRACAKGRKTERALTLHEIVRHKKLPLDSYFYAAVIEACAKAKMWKKALDFLDEMEKEGVPPTDVIYSVTISACANAGQWRKALGLVELMREKGMRINLYVYNSAINALAKAAKNRRRSNQNTKLSSRAMDLLKQMRADGVKPDGFTFSSAISCCGAEGRWEDALGLMDQMKNGGPSTRPNKIAYTAAISACGRAGESQAALRLFREMSDVGLSPDRVTYNALFSALRVSGEADTAHQLWEEMCCTDSIRTTKSQTTTPDIITVTDVIATLKDDHSKVDKVFDEAVKRGIVLAESKTSLDNLWEVDLSSMSFPVARAACRYVVKRARLAIEEGQPEQDLSLITGFSPASPSKTMSKREYLQEILLEDFSPPIKSLVPRLAQGTVQIDKAILKAWIQRRRNG